MQRCSDLRPLINVTCTGRLIIGEEKMSWRTGLGREGGVPVKLGGLLLSKESGLFSTWGAFNWETRGLHLKQFGL